MSIATTPAIERAAEVIYDRHTTNVIAEFDDISDESRGEYAETGRAALAAALPTDHDSTLVEEAARAAFLSDAIEGHHNGVFTWESIPAVGRQNYRRMVVQVLDALRAHVLGGAR